MYSDSTITDEPLVQQTDERLNADDEDAHPSTDTVDSADESESAESALQQITNDETVQEDTLDMYTEEIENLNPVRRSTRERRQPAWLRSGEFDIM